METPSKTNSARYVSWKFGRDIAKTIMAFQGIRCPAVQKKINTRVFDHSAKKKIVF